MYDPGEDFGHDGHEDEFGHEDEDSEEIQNELWQEACWIVISAYFEEKGEQTIYEKPSNYYFLQLIFRFQSLNDSDNCRKFATSGSGYFKPKIKTIFSL